LPVFLGIRWFSLKTALGKGTSLKDQGVRGWILAAHHKYLLYWCLCTGLPKTLLSHHMFWGRGTYFDPNLKVLFSLREESSLQASTLVRSWGSKGKGSEKERTEGPRQIWSRSFTLVGVWNSTHSSKAPSQ
jgi:hypothetical protein